MYIGPKSRTERPRKTKIGTGVAHVPCDSDTTFRVKRSRSLGRFGWLFKSLHSVYRRDQFLCHRPERAAVCRSWIFMAQGALGAAGERRVGYGLEVGCSARTVGRAGHIASPRAQHVILVCIRPLYCLLTEAHVEWTVCSWLLWPSHVLSSYFYFSLMTIKCYRNSTNFLSTFSIHFIRCFDTDGLGDRKASCLKESCTCNPFPKVLVDKPLRDPT